MIANNCLSLSGWRIHRGSSANLLPSTCALPDKRASAGTGLLGMGEFIIQTKNLLLWQKIKVDSKEIREATGETPPTADLHQWMSSSNVKSPARADAQRMSRVSLMNSTVRKPAKPDAKAVNLSARTENTCRRSVKKVVKTPQAADARAETRVATVKMHYGLG